MKETDMLPVSLRRRRGLAEPFSDVERAFGRLFRPWWPEAPSAEGDLAGAYPVDIHEEDGRLVVDAEMPGFTRDEIDVTIDNGVLRITAERKPEETKGTSHLRERRFTRVERAFTLPTDVDDSQVQARLENGVLHLELQETEASKPKQIEIT
jgi:HSP20 family protein